MRTKRNTANQVLSARSTQEIRPPAKPGSIRGGRERILVEFPSRLLERADKAAAQLEKNRSELIRAAVEQMLDALEKERFEREMEEGYVANSALNLSVLEEFAHVDREGF